VLYKISLTFLPFTVASTEYRVTVPEESVIVGNSALIKCSIPSFVADFVHVIAWIDSEGVELASLDHGKCQMSSSIDILTACSFNSVSFSPPKEKRTL
jgi:hypothetical protein